MVVAVPTKNKLAFSSPALVGWSFVALAFGSDDAKGSARLWSRVGCSDARGLIVRCFIFALSVYEGFNCEEVVVWSLHKAQLHYI
jgi:hypothetical protein